MGRKGWRGWLRSILSGLFTCIVLLPMLHHFWWDRHPGSEVRSAWLLLATLLISFFAFLASYFVKEYWPVFFNSSQEEQHGIQR